MAITYGFFDSVDGDRVYNAEQMSSYFDGLISNGVYENIGNRFLVQAASSGLSVTVASGRAIIDSHWIKNDSVATVSLDPSSAQYGRIDAICLRLNKTERTISLVAKTGTASANPALPEITRNGTVYELYIASVYVAKQATQPTSITDLRASSYCGWVTGLIEQVDTSDLFNQWEAAYAAQFAAFDAYIAQKQAAFTEWFENLTQTLNVDTSIKKFENYVTLPQDTFYVNIGIDDFDSRTDVLFVYLDGKHLIDGKDYAVNGHFIQSATMTFLAGSIIDFVALKNVIGAAVVNESPAGVVQKNVLGEFDTPAGIVEETEGE